MFGGRAEAPALLIPASRAPDMECDELHRQMSQEWLRLAEVERKANRAEEKRFFDWLDQRKNEGPRQLSIKLPETASRLTRTTA